VRNAEQRWRLEMDLEEGSIFARRLARLDSETT